jgi:ribosomal protein L10
MSIYEQIQNVKDSYERKAEAARKDSNLSQPGKNKVLGQLEAEKQAALKSFVPVLREQAIKTALKIKSFSGAAQALGQLEAEKFDYGRLTYEAQAVKSALVLAGDDPFKVAKMFEDAKAGHDKYRLKAWLDVAPALIPEKTIHAATWGELKADFANSADLIKSDERAKYDDERRSFLNELDNISVSTQTIADEFSTPSSRNEAIKARVFEGIALDGKSGELHVDLGQTADETPDATFSRLEREYSERVNAQAEVFKNFGSEYDPILDGA